MMRRTLTRRNFLKASGGALVGAYALGLAGCGGGSEGGSSKNLEFWTFDPGRRDFAKAAYESERFKSKHPDVKFNFRVFPYEQGHDKLLTALVSGRGAPDVADIEITRFSQFIKGDRVPLIGLKDRVGDKINDIYKPAAVDPWSWQGEIYGLGNELNTVVMIYRKDIMEGAGIKTPFETWDDAIAAGKEISTDDRKMFAIHDLSFGDWYMLTQHAGTSFFDQNGEYNGDDPRSIEAMQFNHDLVYKHKVADIAPAEQNDNWAPPQYQAAFKAGRFAATWGPPWHLFFIEDGAPNLSGKWGVQRLPQGLGESRPTANYGGTGQCITEQCGNVEAAWTLIETANLTTGGALADFKGRNIYPAYRPAYENPTLRQPVEYFGGAKLGELYAELAPELPPAYQSPVWLDAVEALQRDVITPVMNNKKEAKPALVELRSTIEELQNR
ncbi:MAG TPA: extracellular solute-binding protein [Rubrobacteraceae bacterium]|jgi:arabinosaccharide transport system substrate-binding protein|nr:extracellular solute-binding protein [Rubrobacteraceae bacterium]